MDALITSSSNSLAGNIKQDINPSSCQDEISSSGVSNPSSISNSNLQGKNPQLNIAANKLKAMMENKIKLENGESVSELLGSVIMDSCHGVRTSARVIQKMKENSARPTTPPLTEKEMKLKEEKSLQKTPSQTRPNKVVWSNLERNFFFDAINEFGKDFEAIANYINIKLKRKCPSDQFFKTKEQIRTLYYQTFHKLSKYIKFSDDVKKPVQELYALINYGEMRRKLQFVSEKNYMKIKGLIYKGYTIARSKGKNIRIKTPSCKALRRLNQLEDWLEDIKLPPKVEVQLRPATMGSFLQVQGLAQNPLVKTSVPLQKKLANILKTFQNKWRSKESKLSIEATKIQQQQQACSSSAYNIKTAGHNSDMCSINSIETNNLNSINNEPLFCLKPLSEAVIHRPLLSITEVLSSFNVCLNSYEERIGVKIRGETLCNHLKRQRTESNCEKKSPENKKIKQNDLNISLLDNVNQKQNYTQIKNSDVKIENSIGLQNVNNISIREDLKFTSSGDELDENHLQGDFTEILYDSNDGSDVKFSRQDSNSDIECHTTTLLSSHTSQENLSTNIVNNIDKPVSLLTTVASSNHNNNSFTIPNNDCNFNSNINTTHHNNSQNNNKIKKSKKKDNNINIQKKDMTNVRPLLNDEIIQRIRKGWTIYNANDVTVGDLYIVFGNDSKLIFEYYWTIEDFDVKLQNNISNSIVNHQSDETIFSTGIVAYNDTSISNNSPEQHEQQLKAINKIHTSALSDKLKQLLVIANLSDRMKKKSCFCGHTCDKFAKTRLENEFVNRSVILNKNNTINNNIDTKGNSVFRQPLVPYRKSVFSIDAYRSRQSKIVRGGSVLKSQHLFVQRVLPVQPGLSPHYDILQKNTNEESSKQKNTKQQQKQGECNENEKKSQSTINNNNNLNNYRDSNYSNASSLINSTSTLNQLNAIENFTTSIQQPNKDKDIIEEIINEDKLSNTNSISNRGNIIDKQIFEPSNNSHNHNIIMKSDSNLSMPDLSPIMELSLPSPLHTPKYLEENTIDSQNFSNSIPPISPASLLRDVNISSDSSKWLEENINDYSLSSLLGHLDEINNGRDITSIDRSNISSNLSVISESSVDYVTKFAEIAASMQHEEKDL